MTQLMTQETPGKVMGLLGVAMASMLFLFVVTVATTNDGPLPPNPFAPENVVAVLDTVSHSYAAFLDQNLFAPASAQFAFIQDNVGFVADNAGPQLASLLGLQSSPSGVAQAAAPEQVAGASTQDIVSKYYPVSSGGSIFSFLFGN